MIFKRKEKKYSMLSNTASIGYQLAFSNMHKDIYFDVASRTKKADKMLCILRDFLGEDLSRKTVLDVGCSTGIMCSILAVYFAKVTGIDIDSEAIEHARSNFADSNISFQVTDAMDTGLPAESFDTVICAHIYEHVPDPKRMLREIWRILKPGGICYFAAENRLVFREGDYRLPFLSVLPKPIANLYIRLTKRGKLYYETLLTYWQLKQLVSDYEIIDYTRRVIERPEKYTISDELTPGTVKHKAALAIVRHIYWLFPTYIWLLKK